MKLLNYKKLKIIIIKYFILSISYNKVYFLFYINLFYYSLSEKIYYLLNNKKLFIIKYN